MTDKPISKAAMERAIDTLREYIGGHGVMQPEIPAWASLALARVLQDHSDKAVNAREYALDGNWSASAELLQSMILPDDELETEPFSEVVKRAWSKFHSTTLQPQNFDDLLAKEVDAAGYEICRKDTAARND